MKCIRTPIKAEVFEYKIGQGMEDGFEYWADVVTEGWIVTNSLVKITRQDGKIVCPYIKHRRGITFIEEGDYIILEEDGTKHVCGADKVHIRFQVIE